MAQNTVEILSSINKLVTQIAHNTAPQNKGSETTLKKINQGATVDVSPSPSVGTDVSVASIGAMAKTLAQLPPVIKSIAGLSDRRMKQFTSVITGIVEATQKLDDAAKKSNPETLKYIKELTSVMESVHGVMKKMSTAIIIAPLALVGILLTVPVFIAFNLLMKVVSMVAVSAAVAKKLKDSTEGLNALIGFMYKAALLVLICLGLGVLLMLGDTQKLIIGGLIAFGAVIVVTLVIMLLTGLAAKLIKPIALPALKDMMVFTFGMVLLTGILFAFGYILMKGDTKDIVLGGLIAFGMMILVMLAVVGVAWLASKLITNTAAIGALLKMMLFAYASMLLVVVSKYVGDFAREHWVDILIGFGATVAVMLALVGIAWLASKIQNTAIKGAAAVAIVMALAYATVGLMWLCIDLSEALKGKVGQVALTILGIIGVITVFGALAFGVSFIAPAVAAGSVALLLVVPFVLGSIYMVSQIIEFHKLKEESGVDWGDVYTNVAAIAGVIGAFALIAAVLSLISGPVAMGSIAIIPIRLFVSQSISIVQTLAEFSVYCKENGVNWKSLSKEIGLIAKVIGVFALVAAAMSLALVPALLGLASMWAVEKFVNKSVGMVRSVADLALVIKEAGGGNALMNTVKRDMKNVLGAFNKSNINIPLSIWDIWSLSSKYSAMSGLIRSVASVAMDLSKIASAMGVVDDQGRLSPIVGKDGDGNPIYGDPVDLPKVAELIINSVKAFVSGIDEGFADVDKMEDAEEVFEILGHITEPITKFIELVTGYESGENETLIPVSVDQEGKIIKGNPCNTRAVAKAIVSAVDAFLGEVYKSSNLERWSEYVFGDRNFWERLCGKTNKKTRALNEIAGILGGLVDPLNGLVNMITGFESNGDGKLNTVFVEEGEVRRGPEIDVKRTAKAIVQCINSFLSIVFDSSTISAWNRLTSLSDGAPSKLKKYVDGMLLVGKALNDKDLNADVVSKNAKALSIVTSDMLNADFMSHIKNGMSEDISPFVKQVNMLIDVGVSLSSPNINAQRISTNAEAIGTMLENVYQPMGTLSVAVADVDALTKSLNNLVDVGYRIAGLDGGKVNKNSLALKNAINDIGGASLTDMGPKIGMFSDNVESMRRSLINLDKALTYESDRRKRAIDEFKDSITDLLQKFSGAGESVHELYMLVKYLEDMDAGKISSNVSKINVARASAATSYSADGGASYSGQTITERSVVNDNNYSPSVLSSELANAIKKVFDGAKLRKEPTTHTTAVFGGGTTCFGGGYEIDLN